MNILCDYRRFEHKICLSFFFCSVLKRKKFERDMKRQQYPIFTILSVISSDMALGQKFDFAIINQNNTRGYLC